MTLNFIPIIAAIASMLNLNSTHDTTTSSSDNTESTVWKVLVFDKFGQDIISSIMRVNDLRENGVTVHMYEITYPFHVADSSVLTLFAYVRLLSQDRSPLPDVPAVYFVEPTSSNIKKICEVC